MSFQPLENEKDNYFKIGQNYKTTKLQKFRNFHLLLISFFLF